MSICGWLLAGIARDFLETGVCELMSGYDPKKPSRETWIDNWKGLLILFVVLGHVAGGAYHMSTGGGQSLARWFYRVIYMFHMPAFFVLAGLIWRRHKESMFSFAVKKASRLLIPYAIFAITGFVLFCILSMFGVRMGNAVATTTYYIGTEGNPIWIQVIGILHGTGWPNGEGFRMNSVLWFLPCMFTMLMIYRVLHLDNEKYAYWILAGSFVCSFIQLPDWLPWGLTKVPYFMFFVIFGKTMLSVILQRMERFPVWIWIFCFFGYAVFIASFPPPETVRDFFGWMVLFRILSVTGVLFSAILAKSIEFNGLTILGAMSMGIMLVHKYFVTALQWKVCTKISVNMDSLWGTLSHIVIVTFLAVAASMLATYALSRIFPLAVGVTKKR